MRLSLLVLSVFLAVGGCASVESDWQAANQANTVIAYTAFHSKYADARRESETALRLDEADKRIRELEWEAARRQDSAEVYNDMVKKYSGTEQARLAQSRIDDLEWEEALSLGTREALSSIADQSPPSKHRGGALKRIEGIDWAVAANANSVASYQRFMQKHLSSVHREEALKKIVELKWRETARANSRDEYLAFNSEHPKSQYAEEAMVRVEQIDWQSALRRDSRDAYLAFIAAYPRSHCAKEARGLIEEIDWREALEKDSRDAYMVFRTRHPESEHSARATDRIEDFDWLSAKSRDSSRSFADYIREYPEGRYLREAKNGLAECEWPETKKVGTHSAYESFIAKYPESKLVGQAKTLASEALQGLDVSLVRFGNATVEHYFDAAGSSLVGVVLDIRNRSHDNRFQIKPSLVQLRAGGDETACVAVLLIDCHYCREIYMKGRRAYQGTIRVDNVSYGAMSPVGLQRRIADGEFTPGNMEDDRASHMQNGQRTMPRNIEFAVTWTWETNSPSKKGEYSLLEDKEKIVALLFRRSISSRGGDTKNPGDLVESTIDEDAAVRLGFVFSAEPSSVESVEVLGHTLELPRN